MTGPEGPPERSALAQRPQACPCFVREAVTRVTLDEAAQRFDLRRRLEFLPDCDIAVVGAERIRTIGP